MPVFDNMVTPKRSKKRKKCDSQNGDCSTEEQVKLEFNASDASVTTPSDTITFNNSDTDLSRVLDQVESMSPGGGAEGHDSMLSGMSGSGHTLNTPMTKRRVISLCRESERKRLKLQESVFGSNDSCSSLKNPGEENNSTIESNAWSQLFNSPIKLPSSNNTTPTSISPAKSTSSQSSKPIKTPTKSSKKHVSKSTNKSNEPFSSPPTSRKPGRSSNISDKFSPTATKLNHVSKDYPDKVSSPSTPVKVKHGNNRLKTNDKFDYIKSETELPSNNRDHNKFTEDDDFMNTDIFTEKPKRISSKFVKDTYDVDSGVSVTGMDANPIAGINMNTSQSQNQFDNPPSHASSHESPMHELIISETSPVDKSTSQPPSADSTLPFTMDDTEMSPCIPSNTSSNSIAYAKNNNNHLLLPTTTTTTTINDNHNQNIFSTSSPRYSEADKTTQPPKLSTAITNPQSISPIIPNIPSHSSPSQYPNTVTSNVSSKKDLPPDFRTPISTIENVHASNPFSSENDTKGYQYDATNIHWNKQSLTSSAQVTPTTTTPQMSSNPYSELAPFSFSLTTNSNSSVTTTTPSLTNHNAAPTYRNPFEHPVSQTPSLSNSSAPSPLNLQLPNDYLTNSVSATQSSVHKSSAPLFPPTSYTNSPWMTGITPRSTTASSVRPPCNTTPGFQVPYTSPTSANIAYRPTDSRRSPEKAPPCYLNSLPHIGHSASASVPQPAHRDSPSSFPRETPPPHPIHHSSFHSKHASSALPVPPSVNYHQKPSPPKNHIYSGPPSQLAQPSPATTPAPNPSSLHGIGMPGPYFNSAGLPAGGLLPDKGHPAHTSSSSGHPIHGSTANVPSHHHSSLPSPHNHSMPGSTLTSPHIPSSYPPHTPLHPPSPLPHHAHHPSLVPHHPSTIRAQQYMDPTVVIPGAPSHSYPHSDGFYMPTSDHDRTASLYKLGHALPVSAVHASRPTSRPLTHQPSGVGGLVPPMHPSTKPPTTALVTPLPVPQPPAAKTASTSSKRSTSSKKSRSKKKSEPTPAVPAPAMAPMLPGFSDYAPRQAHLGAPFNPMPPAAATPAKPGVVAGGPPPGIQKDMRPTYLGGSYISALPPTGLFTLTLTNNNFD